MFLELITIIGMAAIPAAISFFLDYCLGLPGSNQPNTRAVFFRYTYSLAYNRLRQNGVATGLNLAFADMINNPMTKEDGLNQFRTAVVLEAQKYYTWEMVFGMCIFCTNFYICLAASILMFFFVPLHHFNPLCFFIFIPIFSHLFLRKL